MNRDEKLLERLVVDAVEMTKVTGQALFGFGLHMAHVKSHPKLTAGKLMEVATQFQVMADATIDLANKIIDWDTNRLVTNVNTEIVNAYGRKAE